MPDGKIIRRSRPSRLGRGAGKEVAGGGAYLASDWAVPSSGREHIDQTGGQHMF